MKNLIVLMLLSWVTTNVKAQDFVPIPGSVSEEVKGILLPASCGSVRGQTVPTPMYTIEPASNDNVTILTSPANLVTAGVKGGLLNLTFNPDVATTVNQSGVKIQIPNAQFQELAAQTSAQVQVLPGFTSLNKIRVTMSSIVRVVIGDASTAVPLNVSVSASAILDLQLDGGVIEEARVSSSGSLNAVASTVRDVHIWFSGSAMLQVENPIRSGWITGLGQLSTSAKGSCDNLLIYSSGKCQDQRDMNITVTVGEPYTMIGTIGCNMFGDSNTYLQ